MKIYIQPIGKVNKEILDFLSTNLEKLFGDVELLEPIKILDIAYNPLRNQYCSTILLKYLPIFKDGITLGITEEDLYANNLNFVFGEAELLGKRAIISLKRLNPEFYGMQRNDFLYKIRALKEAVHEIGHVLGLKHCKNRRCVMSFSNSILDVDYKDIFFCRDCLNKLRWLYAYRRGKDIL
ncbi:archaemetzincin family Zn-dependent metalloprotease [Methanocaldococcus indicus]|uniref:archaemetzincin family Zn-dependent metalloprotease n=1 Tax=Methanocaldococcus indicus TaxID=213231 RepID=UPI003C6D842C